MDILHLGQVTIITVDQPLYTLAKQIQWSWPASHGEDHFVMMFGGLHTEIAALKALGDLLESSGWLDRSTHTGQSRHTWDSTDLGSSLWVTPITVHLRERFVFEGILRDTHPTCSSDHSL